MGIKMKKLFDSLRYGDKDTKIYLWSLILLSVAAVVFGVSAVFMLSFFSGMISVICAIIAALIWQNTSLDEKDFQPKPKEDQEKMLEEAGEATENKADKTYEEQGQGKEDSDKKDTQEETGSRVEHYSEKQIVQLMHKNKVKKNNRKVMIDVCTNFRISQSPAYFWTEDGRANFLVLEEEARTIQIPLSKIREITYERGIRVNKKRDYSDFKGGSFVSQVFEDVMPVYYKAIKNGKKGYFKNLYVITPDLKVTNTSARALFDVLKLDFAIHDGIADSQRYTEYYKMAYKANVMWKDQVINNEEYREKIKEIFLILRKRGIQGKTYDELAEQMVESKFITREYAEYYKDLQL